MAKNSDEMFARARKALDEIIHDEKVLKIIEEREQRKRDKETVITILEDAEQRGIDIRTKRAERKKVLKKNKLK